MLRRCTAPACADPRTEFARIVGPNETACYWCRAGIEARIARAKTGEQRGDHANGMDDDAAPAGEDGS